MGKNLYKSISSDPKKLYRILVLTVVGTLVFGLWGFVIYESRNDPSKSPDYFTLFYYSCQLLIGHGVHLEKEIPWQLHAGRIFGLIFLFTAGLTAFALFAHQEMMSIRLKLKWRRNHVVICGLGDMGFRLAKSARHNGKFVVAIEKKEENTSIEQASNNGILVIEGDATEMSVLRQGRVCRAKYIMACCAEDETNVAIASRICELMRLSKRKSTLICRILLKNDDVLDVLKDHAYWMKVKEIPNNYQINFSDLDYHNVVARQCFNQFPMDYMSIDKNSKGKVHVVILGFERMGQHIALQTARLGHFANTTDWNAKIRMTIMDDDIEAKYKTFYSHYKKIDRICDITLRNSTNLDDIAVNQDELTTFIICFEKDSIADDDRNMEKSISFYLTHNNAKIQILSYQCTNTGYAGLFQAKMRKDDKYPKLGAFGMIEDVYTWDVLIHENHDRMAKLIHENYLHTAEISDPEAVKVHPNWDNLAEVFRESNRQVADHLPIKLRAIGYHYEKKKKSKKSLELINDDDVLLLAKMEHKRFCAERWLDGWELADITDRLRKLNSTLKCWEDLEEKDRVKDIDQVKKTIPMLDSFGYGVYPNL